MLGVLVILPLAYLAVQVVVVNIVQAQALPVQVLAVKETTEDLAEFPALTIKVVVVEVLVLLEYLFLHLVGVWVLHL